jgi:hypothetical protein
VCLSALASIAAAEGQSAIAARLLGAVVKALERVGNTLEPPDRAAYEEALSLTRKPSLRVSTWNSATTNA